MNIGDWQAVDDSISYNGMDNDTLFINSTHIHSDTLYYRCKIYNSIWDQYSDSAWMIFRDTTIILEHPENISAEVQSEVTFLISAEGYTPLQFQWFHNTQILEGKNDSVLLIGNITPADTGYYYCNVTGPCGIKDSDYAKLSISDLGLIENDLAEFIIISPNPASDKIQIFSNKDPKITQVQIYNNIGSLVLNRSNSFDNINISFLSPGPYVVKIIGDDWTVNRKLIVE